MTILSVRERIPIIVAGYVVVVIFAGVFVGLGYLPENVVGTTAEEISVTERLIISAIAVAPLLLALLWDRFKSIKVGEFEISLNEAGAAINVELSTDIQTLDSSATPQLVASVSRAITQPDLKLVEINLRTQPYWWSTRLFLLAALAQEYSNIQRLVIVCNDASRVFVGMVAPAAIGTIARRACCVRRWTRSSTWVIRSKGPSRCSPDSTGPAARYCKRL